MQMKVDEGAKPKISEAATVPRAEGESDGVIMRV